VKPAKNVKLADESDEFSPLMNGIEATKHIKYEFPDTSVIGLSVEDGMDMVQRMRAAGIFAYLRKESIVPILCHVIEDAVAQKQ
jgi:DNA-binding NarL/FixJ family response regulator